MNNRREKIDFLFKFFMAHHLKSKMIVFFNTCATVEFYSKLFNSYFQQLKKEIAPVYRLHGQLKSKKRISVMKEFRESQYGCMFATDVVSRGIDFEEVHFILQVDPPEDPDNYVHRIGRTARINKPGTVTLTLFRPSSFFSIMKIPSLTTWGRRVSGSS